MNDTITLYYYTAWDGFAWQGCDEDTANSLQGYMEAAKTLPKSSADEPPYGGAVPCKIAGRTGVAVYRYMTREKGDLSGRDCFYIALAFIPLDVGCVDFAKLLDLPQLSKPQKGELTSQSVSVSEYGLRMACGQEVPKDWLDSDISCTTYGTLRGREGLQTLSRLFFSTHTQLGFLNAVFRLEAENAIVSRQTYSVYPEVLKVASASGKLRNARILANGFLPDDHKAVAEMNLALCELDKWAAKQRGYPGLKAYHDEKKREMSDAGDRIRVVARYVDGLNMILGAMRHSVASSSRCDDDNVRYMVERCLDKAKELESVPIVDHESYRDALRLSNDALRHSAECLGEMRGLKRAVRAEEALKASECERKNLESQLERVKRELVKSQALLKKKDEKSRKSEERSRTSSTKQERGYGNFLVRSPKRISWFSGGLGWALAGLAGVVGAAIVCGLLWLFFLIIKNTKGDDFFPKALFPSTTEQGEVHKKSAVSNVDSAPQPPSTNSVPAKPENGKREKPPSDGGGQERKDR